MSGRAALGNALCFVAGFSAVFIALWASIGLIGWSLGPYSVYVRIAGGAALVLMGLHVAGILSISRSTAWPAPPCRREARRPCAPG